MGEAISLPARNIPVLIHAKKEKFLSSTGSFFEKYWQFLITAIMIPIISAWVASIVRQRGTQPKTPLPEPYSKNSEGIAESEIKRKKDEKNT